MTRLWMHTTTQSWKITINQWSITYDLIASVEDLAGPTLVLQTARERVLAYRNPGNPIPNEWYRNLDVSWTKPERLMPWEYEVQYGNDLRKPDSPPPTPRYDMRERRGARGAGKPDGGGDGNGGQDEDGHDENNEEGGNKGNKKRTVGARVAARKSKRRTRRRTRTRTGARPRW
ncbi:hypothetical protein F4780DRAFT_707318 [Xylariomycetidae sp. FL0641]|nr:hypothetical protein F4780DRAFT_707318 [Xylariomycetidae sp. FL0641]